MRRSRQNFARCRAPLKATVEVSEPTALWHLLKYKEPFNPEVFRKEEEKMKRKKVAHLQHLAAAQLATHSSFALS